MISAYIGKMDTIARPFGWLLVFLLCIQEPLPGAVLCFGVNGHVAVEVQHSRFPHPTPQSQAPCLDLPLVSVQSNASPLVLMPSLALQGRLFVSTMALASLPLFATTALVDLVPSRALTTLPPLAALRTVILLI
jgi:hypothetical protein